MSSEEPDLPVAVRCMREQNGYPDLESTAIGRSILEEGDELVRKSDAEETIQQARQAERQKILDKIKDKRAEFNNGRSSEHPQKVLTELLEEVEQS